MTTMPTKPQVKPVKQQEKSLKTIVFATDFSSNAQAAGDCVRDLATAHGARVIVVHAIDSAIPPLPEAEAPIGQFVDRKLAECSQQLESQNIKTAINYEFGKPWEVIAQIAKRNHADLIVVGAHGASSISERVLGTVTDRLIKTCSTPILVHRKKDQSVARFRTALAATDFSEASALAISAAIRILRGTNGPARLVLFHTIPLIIPYSGISMPLNMPQYWDDAERTAAKQMETIAAPLRSENLQVQVTIARGYPSLAILEEADRIGADVIAIGTVGRSGLDRFLMGSVAERVLHHAKCPVLTVRQPDSSEPVRVSVE